jgi:hypothetical protein
MYLLDSILEGKDIDEIIEGIPSERLRKRQIRSKKPLRAI